MNKRVIGINDHSIPLNNATRRMSIIGLLWGISGCLIFVLAAITYAQVCGSSSQTAWKTFKTRDAQGLMHVTVNYSGGTEGAPNATMQRLMQEAVAEWNLYKCSTGLFLSLRW